MDDLMDRVEIAHDLITRLRQLLTMEKTDSVMDHSLNRTRFFKMDDDYSKHFIYIYTSMQLSTLIYVHFQKHKMKSEKIFDKKR